MFSKYEQLNDEEEGESAFVSTGGSEIPYIEEIGRRQ